MTKPWFAFRSIESDTLEILRHAVIGGLVAVTLIAFHARFQEWVAQTERLAHWRSAVFLSFTFLIVFVGIAILEHMLRKWQWNAKIPLQESGEIVDGRWIEVIVENGKPTEASVVEIRSARGSGFAVRGTSYPVDSHGRMSHQPCGRFTSAKGSLFPENGISYPLVGKRGGKDHFGVGFYQFGQPATKTCFEGAFLARQEKSISHVIGSKVDDGIPDDHVLAILEKFLTDQSVTRFLSEHS